MLDSEQSPRLTVDSWLNGGLKRVRAHTTMRQELRPRRRGSVERCPSAPGRKEAKRRARTESSSSQVRYGRMKVVYQSPAASLPWRMPVEAIVPGTGLSARQRGRRDHASCGTDAEVERGIAASAIGGPVAVDRDAHPHVSAQFGWARRPA